MSDNVMDITEYVKMFDMSVNVGVPKITDGQDTVWEFGLPHADINLEFDSKELHNLLKWEQKYIVKMEQRGRFWFDRKMDCDVIMTDLTLSEDGGCTATYQSMNINDLTNYNALARFLRWILRR